jgi:hypothetical protein
MKMNKQTIQVLVLSALMLVLIIGAVMTYGGGGTPTPPPPAPTSNDKPGSETPGKPVDSNGTSDKPEEDSKAVRKKGNPADLLWIDTGRLVNVVSDVKGGADPFEDLMTPPPPIIPNANANDIPSTVNNSGNVSPLPAIDTNITQKINLIWLNAVEIKKLLKNEGFNLKIKTINNNSRFISMTGMRIDIEDALKIIREADKEPPKPKFRLVGVLKTSTKNFVILAVNGQQYELYEGDTINKLGWCVAAINNSGVRLTKGRQTILLPIGGQP